MNFEFIVTDEQVEKAKQAIEENGGMLNGDNSFSIMGVTGHFYRNGRVLTVRITDKPFLASWGTIERKLTEFFS